MRRRIRGVLIDLSGAQGLDCSTPRVALIHGVVLCSGTLHVDDTVIPGAIEALRKLLRQPDLAVRFGALSSGVAWSNASV